MATSGSGHDQGLWPCTDKGSAVGFDRSSNYVPENCFVALHSHIVSDDNLNIRRDMSLTLNELLKLFEPSLLQAVLVVASLLHEYDLIHCTIICTA